MIDGGKIREYISVDGKKVTTIAFSDCTYNRGNKKEVDEYIYEMMIENILNVNKGDDKNENEEPKIEDGQDKVEGSEQIANDDAKKELLMWL